ALPRAAPDARRWAPPPAAPAAQLGLFAAEEHAVVRRLRELDPNSTTPLDALRLLAELVEEARKA
ncbi:MAG TPA: hypothetical protein VHQ45_14880, partial [Gemmatimonadaceae bacterium]|nr:hypothetical protein [Gemmatimonadaceae bacterium]